jgi:hypothetical protein
MFQKFEHISNLIGKKALHVLFVFALFFQCSSCASYLLFAEDNFKCPICEIIKGFNKNKFTYSKSEIININVTKERSFYFEQVILKEKKELQQEAQVIIEPKAEENIISIRNRGVLVLFFKNQTHKEIQHHLFLKYCQLKIGNQLSFI